MSNNMKTLIETIEIGLGKTLEQIIDVTTMKWICKPCKDKAKFFPDKLIINAAVAKKEMKTHQ